MHITVDLNFKLVFKMQLESSLLKNLIEAMTLLKCIKYLKPQIR
jgi:hypothetical protein